MGIYYYYCTKCKTLVADEGPHEAKHHRKYMKRHFPGTLLGAIEIQGKAIEIIPTLSEIIKQLLISIRNDDDGKRPWERTKCAKILPYCTQLIKRSLSVLDDTEYEEEVDGSTSEEDEDDEND
jgi:hypothetical protein